MVLWKRITQCHNNNNSNNNSLLLRVRTSFTSLSDIRVTVMVGVKETLCDIYTIKVGISLPWCIIWTIVKIFPAPMKFLLNRLGNQLVNVANLKFYKCHWK